MTGLTFDASDSLMGKGREAFFNNLVLAAQNNGVYSGCAVSEKGAGADMSVDVATGFWRAGNTANYVATAATNKAISAAHATLDRYDLVSAKSDGTFNVTTGTAASAPKVPSIPADSVALAVVFVEAAATSIADASITDVRVLLEENRLVVLHSSNTAESSSSAGTTLMAFTVTAEQAKYPRLLVTYSGEYEYSNNTGSAKVYVDTTEVGSAVNFGAVNNSGLVTGYHSVVLDFMLIAGTHYTRGTGFTLSVLHKTNGAYAGAKTLTIYHGVVCGVT